MAFPHLLLLATLSTTPAHAAPPDIQAPQREFYFGKVRRGAKVRHSFALENKGAGRLDILGIDNTDNAVQARMSRYLAAHTTGEITLELNTETMSRGPVEAGIVLQTNNPAAPELAFTLKGEIEPLIDVQPYAAVFLSAWRGETAEQEVTIVNNDPRPLAPAVRPYAGGRFSCALETLKKGRLYKLAARLTAGARPGKAVEEIVIDTGHPEQPELKIKINTFVKNFVYADPGELHLGDIDRAELAASPALWDYLGRTVFIRRKARDNFSVEATTDLPFLKVTTVRGSRPDVAELRLSLIREKVSAGPFAGKVTVTTSDPDFPALEVPVDGLVR